MALIAFSIVAVTAVVLFVLGFVAPRRARGTERSINRAMFSGEQRSKKAPGRFVPKALRKSLRGSRVVADKSAEAGRGAPRKAPS